MKAKVRKGKKAGGKAGKKAGKERKERIVSQIYEKIDQGMECLREARQMLEQWEAAQPYMGERLIVKDRDVPAVMKVLARAILDGLVRAERKESRRHLKEVIIQHFFFCKKGKTDECLSFRTAMNYLEEELSHEISRRMG